MEITIDTSDTGISDTESFDIGEELLQRSTSRIDDTEYRVQEDSIVLVAWNEDAVWNVWREMNKMADSAKTEEAENVASNMADELEQIMNS